MVAIGISTMEAPSSARSGMDLMCPALAWQTNRPQPAAMTAPHTASQRDSHASGR
jgi:hypothetical protein